MCCWRTEKPVGQIVRKMKECAELKTKGLYYVQNKMAA
jgi:hypothetical protein